MKKRIKTELGYYTVDSENGRVTLEEDFHYYDKKGRKLTHHKGIINQSFNHVNGYVYVNVFKLRTSVHRIVLKTFNPIKNMDKMEVNHIDGDKHNNCLANLEWTTRKENMIHASYSGLINRDSEKRKKQTVINQKKSAESFFIPFVLYDSVTGVKKSSVIDYKQYISNVSRYSNILHHGTDRLRYKGEIYRQASGLMKKYGEIPERIKLPPKPVKTVKKLDKNNNVLEEFKWSDIPYPYTKDKIITQYNQIYIKKGDMYWVLE